jgi:hypothetical protein
MMCPASGQAVIDEIALSKTPMDQAQAIERGIVMKHVIWLLLLVSGGLVADAETDFQQGLASFRAGDYAASLQFFEAAERAGMDRLALHYNLGSSHFKLGNFSRSEAYYRRVAEIPRMQSLAHYNLGLISLNLADWSAARGHFQSVVDWRQDDALVRLARRQLAELARRDDLTRIYLSLSAGYDDNVTAAPDNTAFGQSDSYLDQFVFIDWLFHGRRNQGWALEASLFNLDFSDGGDNDEYQLLVGMKRELALGAWNTSVHLNTGRNNFGGDDYQSFISLEFSGDREIGSGQRLDVRFDYDDYRSEDPLFDYLEGTRLRLSASYIRYIGDLKTQWLYELESNDRGWLITPDYRYDYSPLRHTLRGKISKPLESGWVLGAELSWRHSDYPASTDFNRDDDLWRLAMSAQRKLGIHWRVTGRLQYLDNTSSVDRYRYDKTAVNLSFSRLF